MENSTQHNKARVSAFYGRGRKDKTEEIVFISMCSYCKKIRENGEWIRKKAIHDDKKISHGVCPDCFNKAMEELLPIARQIKREASLCV